MRVISRPSTAMCNVELYSSYLLAEPLYTSCTRLSDIMGSLSHDSINRFLNRERFSGQDLFDEVKSSINLKGGSLGVDDSTLDKPYAEPKHNELVGYFWSGKHKQTVKGVCLVTLYYTDVHGVKVPVNYRVYDSTDGKTKNDYFQSMVLEVLSWGIEPSYVTGDSWYSSLGNLKFLRNQDLNSLFAVERNRLVSIEKGSYLHIQNVDNWSDNGVTLYLKGYGMVKAFRQVYKNEYRYYVMSMSNLDKVDGLTYQDFEKVHADHWSIECYHRVIKQACNIEKFQVRNKHAVLTHIYCSLIGFLTLEFLRVKGKICNHYQIQKDLYQKVIKEFVSERLHENAALNNA